jgi:hypothetical protein
MSNKNRDPPAYHQTALEGKNRRIDEYITPAEPVHTENFSNLLNKGQRCVMLNFAGPGDRHCPRTSAGCAVRFLMCGKDFTDFNVELQDSDVTTYGMCTHTALPMFEAGPGVDDTITDERCSLLLGKMTEYLARLDKEFREHVEKPEDIRDTLKEFTGTEVSDSTTIDGTRTLCASENVPHHPFFVVTFVPFITSEQEKDYNEPLLAVFGSFNSEDDADKYARYISKKDYSDLELFVVEGGTWIYPSVLGSTAAEGIRALFPNVPKLESIVGGVMSGKDEMDNF